MHLTQTLAASVAARMRRDGFDCQPGDVWLVYDLGSLRDRPALESRILQELGELGFSR